MRTLEQTICECTRKAEANRELAKYNKSHVDRVNDLKNAEECEQLAAWLRELQERRKAPEIVFCKDCRKHNVRVGYEVSFKTNWRDDACPLADWRGKVQGHEFDYQYCVYAERRTDGEKRSD